MMNPMKKRNGSRLGRWAVGETVFLLGLFLLVSAPSWSDIITLKDGTILPCEVVEQSKSASGAEYLQIRINNSLVWLSREAVSRIEKTPERKSTGSDIQSLLQRLIQEGKIVPDLKDSVKIKPSAAPAPALPDITLKAKEIRGWVYLYEDPNALKERRRIPLQTGDSIPKGFILASSPNTRLTLGAEKYVEIGLEGGTQIRFDDALLNPSSRSFKLDVRLLRGKAWFQINITGSSWNSVSLNLNTVRSVLQNMTFYAEAAGRTAAVNITYLNGTDKSRFWREKDGPYLLNIGQVLEVSPAANRLPISDTPMDDLDRLNQKLAGWMQWKPETLAVDLDIVIPPLETFPAFPPQAALHAYAIPIDQNMIVPPETCSLGQIIATYKAALEKYKYDTGHYPTNEHGLEALTKSFNISGWRGPYVSLDLPRRDLWGMLLVYEVYIDKGRQYVDVHSMGPNRKEDRGLGDDIR